jgi:hypothetical protein
MAFIGSSFLRLPERLDAHRALALCRLDRMDLQHNKRGGTGNADMSAGRTRGHGQVAGRRGHGDSAGSGA